MARSLLRAGLATTVWNRDPAKAEPLAAAGARVATTVDDALAGSDVVLTMLFDATSVAAVLQSPLAAGTFPSEAVWLQCSTTGLAGTARLAELAAEAGVAFVDAPVLGTKQPAEEGNLVVLCSGPEHVRSRVAPVIDALGSKTLWVGDQPGQASALKLVCNAWVTTLNNAVAQSISLAQALGLDPLLFLAAIDSGPVNAPFAQFKGRLMLRGNTAESAFTLDGALKDAELIGGALRDAGVDGTLMSAVTGQIRAASSAGYGSHDMAAVIRAFR
jgi:3-hydroxyisobutyrate dehydrogenase